MEESKKGIVAYVDGSCRPNPGRGGWGMHGYVYNYNPVVKPTAIDGHVLTTGGYVNAALVNGEMPTDPEQRKLLIEGTRSTLPLCVTKSTPVFVETYFDGYGSFQEDTTNNAAELVGAISAMQYAQGHNVKELLIKTDSEYVKKGLENFVPKWKSNHWLKADGQPPANVTQWRALYENRQCLLDKGVTVELMWVKGHNGVFGNEIADNMAVIGTMASKDGAVVNSIESKPALGYWKYDAKAHPFIYHKYMYYNTIASTQAVGKYYMGNHGKDEALIGNRISDATFSVVILKEPDPILELIRNRQTALAHGRDAIAIVRVDHAFRAGTHQKLTEYGHFAMNQPNPYSLDLMCLDDEPLARELRTPKIAMRAIDALAELETLINRFKVNDPELVVTEYTDILYETTDKKGKKGVLEKETLLKPEFKVGHKSIDLQARHKRGGEIISTAVTLTLAIDIPDRNTLKRLEKLEPKVCLITWAESEEAFRYATVIETNDAVSIWAGIYSNLRIV